MFKVTAHSLPKDTLWVKYEPEWAKGREDMLGKVISDGQTDGQTILKVAVEQALITPNFNPILQLFQQSTPNS